MLKFILKWLLSFEKFISHHCCIFLWCDFYIAKEI